MRKKPVNGWSARQWDNGWTVMPDSTVNNVEFAAQYAKNKELWDKLLNFIANTDLKSLEPGKVVLVPGRLWINVMAYTPKSADETAAEVHRKYIDLQYTFEGNELMGLVNKVTPTGDYDAVKDVQKFTPAEPVSYVPAAPDRFSFISLAIYTSRLLPLVNSQECREKL